MAMKTSVAVQHWLCRRAALLAIVAGALALNLVVVMNLSPLASLGLELGANLRLLPAAQIRPITRLHRVVEYSGYCVGCSIVFTVV